MQGPTQSSPLELALANDISPPPVPPEVSLKEADAYFDAPRKRAESPISVQSDATNLDRHLYSTTSTALTALQYLPVPLVVLSSTKTAILANDAFAKLLGIDLPVLAGNGETLLSITDIILGRNLAQLGLDLLQNGSPILVSWEVCDMLIC
jgi:hypothetical protein